MLVLFSHPDFTGVPWPAVPALAGPAVAHAISWNRMWEDEQEIKQDSLSLTFYKISVLTTRFYCHFFSAKSNSKNKNNNSNKKNPLWLLCDTWTGLAFYIKIEFLSENKEQKNPKHNIQSRENISSWPSRLWLFIAFSSCIWHKYWTLLCERTVTERFWRRTSASPCRSECTWLARCRWRLLLEIAISLRWDKLFCCGICCFYPVV